VNVLGNRKVNKKKAPITIKTKTEDYSEEKMLIGHNINRPKTEADTDLIKAALDQHFIFSNLPAEDFTTLINAMKLFGFDAKEFIY
jgi:hypothetical protein